jgi:hypothetical protein
MLIQRCLLCANFGGEEGTIKGGGSCLPDFENEANRDSQSTFEMVFPALTGSFRSGKRKYCPWLSWCSLAGLICPGTREYFPDWPKLSSSYTHCKKGYCFSRPQPGNIKLFLARDCSVSDITAEDGKNVITIYAQCRQLSRSVRLSL